MSRSKLVVVGSSNTDLVVRVPRLPAPGETVVGADLTIIQGGKGANQAVAAARLGADVCFIARVGDDSAGAAAIAAYASEGIDTSWVQPTPGVPTGTALIPVEERSGRNSIVVSPGANAHLSPHDILQAEAVLHDADWILVSLEIAQDTVDAVVAVANRHNVPVLCNPAPARSLPEPTLRGIAWMTPNEDETRQLGGPEALLAHGIQLVSTHGPEGAKRHTRSGMQHFSAPDVTAVDTVAAGDCFTAALAVALSEGADADDAIRFAVTAASLKVTKQGAQPGLPRRAEVESFIRSLGR